MESKIPLPTDNIYKFYALFGLFLFITCIASSVYVSRSTNELIFSATIEMETLSAIKEPSSIDNAKKKIWERKVELALADKNFFLRVLGGIAGVGCLLMGYGFLKWHNEVQPLQLNFK